MWTCKYCGHENKFGVFCEACGKKSEPEAVPFPAKAADRAETWRCSCGAENEAGYRFCSKCGKPRSAEKSTAPAAEPETVPVPVTETPEVPVPEITEPEIPEVEQPAEREISDDDLAAITAAVLAEYSGEEQETVKAAEKVQQNAGWTCSACGKANRDGMSYCAGCGASRYPNAPATKKVKTERPKTRPENKPAETAKTQKAKAPAEREDRGSRNMTVLIIIMAAAVLALIAILIFVLANGGFSGSTSEASNPASTAAVTETQAPAESSPDVTASPEPTATPDPSPTPTPSPTPAPEYLLADSNTRYLTEADISSLTHEELCFARNEIYARHGYIFKTAQIAAYFAGKSWYSGTTSNADAVYSTFNAYEIANITLIKNYENSHYGGSYY